MLRQINTRAQRCHALLGQPQALAAVRKSGEPDSVAKVCNKRLWGPCALALQKGNVYAYRLQDGLSQHPQWSR